MHICYLWVLLLQMLDEIAEVVEVKDSEPIVILENDTAFWLSHLEDPSYHFKLVPDSLNKSETELSHFRTYKSGAKTELAYTVLSEVSQQRVPYTCNIHVISAFSYLRISLFVEQVLQLCTTL